MQIFTFEQIQYIVWRVPRTKEWHVAYKMPSTMNMESQEAFTRRAQKRLNHQDHQSLKEMQSIIDLKVWEENVNETTLVVMKQKKQRRT